jgi:hypothetical protein
LEVGESRGCWRECARERHWKMQGSRRHGLKQQDPKEQQPRRRRKKKKR